jgi:ATP-dependent helicase/nuclease subunit A
MMPFASASTFRREIAQDDVVVWPMGAAHPLVEVPEAQHDAWRRACAKQLARIDSLRSQTIHSFCQSLLRQFPIEAKLDPQFKIIEGFERSLLYAQLYDAWIDAETRVDPRAEDLREWETLVEHIGYLFLIREILFSLVDRRDLLLDERYECGEMEEVEEQLVAALGDIRRGGWPEAIAAHVAEKAPPVGGGLDAWCEYLQPIAAEIRASKLPRKKNEQILADALKVLRAGDSGACAIDRLVSHRAALAARSLASRFIRFLDDEKRKLGVVDFDDLLLRTQSLLDDEKVLERVRAQFDFIFVDEFQDTDRVQAKIIDRLARDRSGALVPGRTVVVGDPKQSIYGFRRADPETYDRFTRAMRDDGAEWRRLEDQYRSDAPLLDAINAIFARMFPPQALPDPNVFRPEYRELRAARSFENRRDPITILDVECDDRDARHTAEADAIASWIQARRSGGLRRFAILLRRTTYLDDYLDALDRHDLDYVLPPTRLFLDRRAPVDLLAVLRAVAYPFDRGAEISAARTPYFALTDDEIVEGSAGAPAAGAADSGRQGEAWECYVEAIGALRASSKHLTVSQLIDHIVASCNIEAVYGAAADGTRALRHLEHVRTIAFQYDQKSGGSVRQFVDEIARRRSDPDEMEPNLADDANDAVRILTVHAAKGLEFETVILPDLEFPNKAAEAFVVEEPPSLVLRGQVETLSSYYRRADGVQLKEIAKEREEAEMRRLFYVAVTRAMRDVVFVVGQNARKMGFQKCVAEIIEWGIPVVVEKVAPLEAMQQRRRRLRDAELEHDLLLAPIAPLECGSKAAAFVVDESGGFAAALQRKTGILLHRVLERWDGSSPVDPLINSLAAEQGIEREVAARVRQRLAIVAKSETLQRIARAETIGREVPIAILENGNVIERRIDRWLREKDNDLVIDYKSGAPSENDRQQVEQYRRAITAMTGRPCTGLLWYIGTDQDQIVELRPTP